MGNTSRIAKNTIALYFRSLFILLIALYTSRVVLQTLGVIDYGLYNVVGGIVTMIGFLNTSMNATYQRYFTYELGANREESIYLLFKSAISVQFIIGCIILLVAETIGLWFLNSQMQIPTDRVFAANCVYQISILSFFINIFCIPYIAIITAYEEMGAFAVISIINYILNLVLVLLLPLFEYDKLIVYALMQMFLVLFTIILYVLYCNRKIKIVKFGFNWDKTNLKTLLSFSGWGLLDPLSYTLKSQGLNILLNMFFNPVVNAARGISYQILTAVNQFIGSFQTAFRPQLTKSYAGGDFSYMRKLYYGATKISYYLIFTISLPILLETSTILHIWLGDNVPNNTISFTRLILLTTFVSAFANPTSCIIYATGKIKIFSILVSGVNLLIVPISYLVLSFGGSPSSVFIVSLCVTIVVQLIRVFVLCNITDLQIKDYYINVVVPTMVVSVICPLIPLFIYFVMEISWLRLLLVCSTSVCCSCIAVWLFGLSLFEKQFVKNKINFLKRRI